jgi:hypothetical protein
MSLRSESDRFAVSLRIDAKAKNDHFARRKTAGFLAPD